MLLLRTRRKAILALKGSFGPGRRFRDVCRIGVVVGYAPSYAVRSYAINAWNLLRGELSGNLRCNSQGIGRDSKTWVDRAATRHE
jgi:hypothetical protein